MLMLIECYILYTPYVFILLVAGVIVDSVSRAFTGGIR